MALDWIRLKKKLARGKRFITIPNVIIATGFLTAIIYIFSFAFPFTDNAFVMNDVRPVAAQVQGYITHLYVQNGQHVTKGEHLFTVFQPPYQLKVTQLEADLTKSLATLKALEATLERDKKTSATQNRLYVKRKQDDEKYQKGYQLKSVSLITLQNSQQETEAARDRWHAAQKQLEIDQHKIKAQKAAIKSIRAKLGIAKVNLDLTNVVAQDSGIVQNLFFTVGAPITINHPLFSLVNMDTFYVQANFNETDLRFVRKGCKALIFPRMYLARKVFHGEVDSDFWSANRQAVDQRTQLQNVTNENQWILLPQRLPVMIRVTDPDPNYPLRVGASAYVYIRTC